VKTGLRSTRAIAMGLSLALANFFGVAAQAVEPSKPIHLIVPYPAGGPSDGTGRVIQPVLAKILNKDVIVENVGGAGGALGAQRILRSGPNEANVLVASPNEIILAPLSNNALTYKATDFTLAGVFGAIPYALVSRPTLEPDSIDQLIAYLRDASHAPLSYGSMGHGSLNHLAGEDFKSRIGGNMFHVPFKGGSPLIQALIGGHVDISFVTFTRDVLQQIQAGNLKFFGLTLAHRPEAFKELATVNEGQLLKGFEYSIFVGLAVDAQSTPEFMQKLNESVSESLEDPALKERLLSFGYIEVPPMDVAATKAFYSEQAHKYQKLSAAIAHD